MRIPRFLMVISLVVCFVSCATLPTDFDRPPSFSIQDTDNTRLGQNFAAEKAAHPGQSGCYLLGNGLDAFVARAALAQSAERSIDLQYYLYHGDLVGLLFTDQLIKAADRGVRVRMLLDDMDLEDRDLDIRILDSHPLIQVRIFNPFSRDASRKSQFVTRLGSVTRRMHNKSFNVDNQVAILGGRNIGNEYFNADPDMEFADLDVMAVGPVVNALSSAFDRYWNSELAYPVAVLIKKELAAEAILGKRRHFDAYIAGQENSVYVRALWNSDLTTNIRNGDVALDWGEANLVYDQPEKVLHGFKEDQYHLVPQLTPYLEGLQKELIIISPYFVPGRSGTAFLTDLVKKGVRVRIATNSLSSNDVGIVHAGYAKYRKTLLRGGVELYEMNRASGKGKGKGKGKTKKGPSGSVKASLHAKSFIFDRKHLFVGSLNLDPRAFLHNTEIGVVVTSPKLAEDFANWLEQHAEQMAFRLELKTEDGTESILWHGTVDGEAVTFSTDPFTSFWRRLGIGFLSLLPIDSQL